MWILHALHTTSITTWRKWPPPRVRHKPSQNCCSKLVLQCSVSNMQAVFSGLLQLRSVLICVSWDATCANWYHIVFLLCMCSYYLAQRVNCMPLDCLSEDCNYTICLLAMPLGCNHINWQTGSITQWRKAQWLWDCRKDMIYLMRYIKLSLLINRKISSLIGGPWRFWVYCGKFS